ncbi:putative methyltransferase-domain-containing protein [Desarmillaria tabescens]|uniref:Methyltransferase-domain-containing protein n=1 Tax=Armillaria tabescens TaxID=1929756 RepID=A0AA39KEI6_ARMTA|nr:putative methyltransferase-domain-containing protein [Desarmillaria tabescens]KAK0459640.1 putative methyltransferase-domain-containing protein [Desarmillaria tabescens]
MPPFPAHATKHLPLLSYSFSSSLTFRLAQSDDGTSNGTALWLGAQVLSVYLAQVVHPRLFRPGMRVIELGSGIGLSALVLSSLGWAVVATDLPTITTTILPRNISTNVPLLSGEISIRQLDWTVQPDQWHDPLITSSFDLIITADTVYTPHLVQPLLRTLHALASGSSRPPPIFLCLERRDPALVDRVLLEARSHWGFKTEQIPYRKISKALDKSGLKWAKEDWEGVEIWKFTLDVNHAVDA